VREGGRGGVGGGLGLTLAWIRLNPASSYGTKRPLWAPFIASCVNPTGQWTEQLLRLWARTETAFSEIKKCTQ
jgi:hypothetical protein